MKIRITITALLLLLFAPASHSAGQELVFSTYPFANPAVIYRTLQPLVKHLGNKTGTEITIRIASSYTDHIKTVGSGKVDLAFVGPSPYVRIKDKFDGIELLARFRMQDDISDKMVIVCRKDAPFKTVADLAGLSFAFGDHQSYGSHYLPRWVLAAGGVPLNRLAVYDFVKSHDNVLLSVLHGDFAAGGVRLDVFRKYGDRPLRVLAGPYLTPPHAIVCRADLPQELKEGLRQALLQLDDPKVLKSINPDMLRFDKVSDRDFDQARKIINSIERR